jgi:hypothetical protein
MLSEPSASSTCQLVYEYLFEHLKIPKEKLTLEMANCIYVGIITDTGSLTYSCNDPKLYLILAQLIKRGVDGEKVHRLVYDNYEESRLHLLGLSLNQRFKILPEYATAYIYLSKGDLLTHNYQIGDTEGFVNYGLMMKNIQLAAIFIQRDHKIRVSFRSKGNFDVNLFARYNPCRNSGMLSYLVDILHKILVGVPRLRQCPVGDMTFRCTQNSIFVNTAGRSASVKTPRPRFVRNFPIIIVRRIPVPYYLLKTALRPQVKGLFSASALYLAPVRQRRKLFSLKGIGLRFGMGIVARNTPLQVYADARNTHIPPCTKPGGTAAAAVVQGQLRLQT